MSGLDRVQLDPDGYVDMDQFPDDGTDLSEADLAQLRATLHADPVEEPTTEQWDAMFDEVVATDDSGPFSLDEADGLVAEDGSSAPPDDVVEGDLAVDAEVDGEGDAPDTDALFDLDGTDLDGTDLDGGLDLAPDATVDDAFSPDALEDVPTGIADDDFEDLL